MTFKCVLFKFFLCLDALCFEDCITVIIMVT